MMELAELEMRSYVPEPERGRRDWEGKEAERQGELILACPLLVLP
jgi:hypothetical protein